MRPPRRIDRDPGIRANRADGAGEIDAEQGAGEGRFGDLQSAPGRDVGGRERTGMDKLRLKSRRGRRLSHPLTHTDLRLAKVFWPALYRSGAAVLVLDAKQQAGGE